MSSICDPMDCSPPGSSVHGFSRQEYWSGLPFPSPGRNVFLIVKLCWDLGWRKRLFSSCCWSLWSLKCRSWQREDQSTWGAVVSVKTKLKCSLIWGNLSQEGKLIIRGHGGSFFPWICGPRAELGGTRLHT